VASRNWLVRRPAEKFEHAENLWNHLSFQLVVCGISRPFARAFPRCRFQAGDDDFDRHCAGLCRPGDWHQLFVRRKSGKLFAIDAGYWLVFYAAMGLVFALLGA
jgi:hypothetical protein